MLKDVRLLTCANIPELVLVSAHFSGLIKKIFLRETEIVESHKDSSSTIYTIRVPHSRLRGDSYIRDNWTSMEEIVNEAFNAILLTLSPEALGKLAKDLFGETVATRMFVANIDWEQDISTVIGDPDIVLCDESKNNLFLIELKIQAKKSNGRFSLQQHTKYSNYIQALETAGKTARAMLLAPSSDYKNCFAGQEVNWFDFMDGNLFPAKDRITGRPSFVTNKSVVDFKSLIDHHDTYIKKFGLNIKPDEYRPIKYRSFSEFKNALRNVAPHLENAFSIIEKNSSSQ
jgi:hypothetical protein